MLARAVGFSALLILLLAIPAAQARSQPAYFENLGPDTYLPGRHVVLTVANPPASAARIYALPFERAIAQIRSTSWQPAINGLSQIGGGQLRPLPDGRMQSFDAGVLTPGYYVASIGEGNTQERWLFSVSSFGLMSAVVGMTTVAWAVDLRTFNGMRRPVSIWWDGTSGRRALHVDADGVAIDRGGTRDGAAVIVATSPDGSRQITPLYNLSPYAGSRVWVSTDRPIYRPGQTVGIRAILRDGWVGAYSIPRGQVHLEVFSADEDRVVADRTLRISLFGTAATTLRLADDAATGPYRISIGKTWGDYFDVVAYRKPEFQLHLATLRPWTIAGDSTTVHVKATYLFGRPVAGMRLQYHVNAPGWYRTPGSVRPLPFQPAFADGDRSLDVADGEAVTDSAGNFDIAFAAPAVDSEKLVVTSVRGTDSSGRTVSAALSLLDHPAAFTIDASPDRWFAGVGRPNPIEIRTRNDDGSARPNQTLSLTVERRKWSDRSRRYDTLGSESQTIATGAGGTATFAWAPVAAGTYAFVVQGADDRNRIATASAYAVAASDESAGAGVLPDQRIRIVPAKSTLAPGERAHLLVMTPVPNRDVFVAVCTDRLVRVQVLHVAGTAATIDEVPPADAARFTVSVTQADETGGSSDTARLTVDPPARRLIVRIAANKPRYEPGETAHLRVDVRDAFGKPTRAEVALGVVDEAIYALSDRREDPFDEFYGFAAELYWRGQWNLTVNPYRAGLRSIATVEARAVAPPPSVSASSDSPGSRVRRDFRDTAFWAPSAITDAQGHARVSFVWPDDLTTWRATGTAVTTATGIGTGTADALVTKDFLVRLATPRFLRLGDRSTLTGIAQGTLSHPAVTLRLSAQTLAPQASSRRARLDANATASVAWPAYADRIGTFNATLYGSDGMRSDAMETSLAVTGATPEEHVLASGTGSGSARMSIPPGYAAGAVTVTIAPSLLAQLVQSLRSLQVYPYYCTEQTLSAALPALFVEEALRRQNAAFAAGLHVREIILKAQRRLYQLRHSDGSYGWWEHDAAHPFMTAYALYGMAELARAGYPVYLDPTVDSLIAQLQASNDDTLRFWGGRQPGSEWNTRAFMLFALADAAPKRVDPAMLAQARAHAQQMNSYALAVLGLAERSVGDLDAARQLLRMLDARVVDNGTTAYWPGQTWDYAWEDDPFETTAYALRLQVALDPSDLLVSRIAAFLRGQLRGGWAYTTKDTAATIYALSETLPADAGEMHPNETVRVMVDGRTIRLLHVTMPIVDAPDAQIVIPAGQVRDGSIVSVVRSGNGALYWWTDLTRFVPQSATAVVDKETPILERLFPPRPEVAIARRYVPQSPGPWRVGERVTVEITVTSRRDLQYVAVEDPFPAGAERPIEQGTSSALAWSGLQFLDDRATFFADRLIAGKPLVLQYTLDLTTPGQYAAPATMVSTMYGPPLRMLGNSAVVTILER